MKLGLTIGTGGANPRIDMDLVLEAERLGYDAVWSGEAYGTDAVTPVTWVLARTTRIKAGTGIMQMPARTPTCVAMTALTLQGLSGNRFLCGIGPSGPQVIEGWHGVPFGKPLARTREYLSIIKQVVAREQPLQQYYWHRPLHVLLNSAFASGLVMDRIEEPKLPVKVAPVSLQNVPNAFTSIISLLVNCPKLDT